MDTSTKSSPIRLGLFLFAAALALDLLALAPSVLPGDGPELTVAARVLGIPHPSGYPLYVALGRVFTLLPAGSIAWRMNLFAAVAGAAAVGVFGAWLFRATGSRAAAVLAAAALATSRTFWRESTSAEVYTLSALFLALLLLVLPERRDQRRFLLSAYLWGLALTNHLALGFLLPAFGAYACLRARPSRRLAAAGAVLFLLGLTPYALLPVRASLAPAWNWGDPSTGASFLAHVLGRGYWGFLGGGGVAGRAADWARALPHELTLLFWAAVPLGLLFLGRARRDLLLPVLGGAGLGLAYALLYGIRDPEAYYLPVHILLLVPVGFLLARPGRRAGWAAAVLAAALIAAQARENRPGDRSLLDEYVANILSGVERGGAVVVEGDSETFGLLHATVVERERPDITLWNPVLDILPSGPVLERFGPPRGSRGPGWKRAALEAALRSGVSVYAVTESDEIRPGGGFRLVPWGLLFRYAREGEELPPESRRALWEGYRTAAADRVSARSGYLCRILAASYPIQRSRQLFLEGEEEEGRSLLDAALSIGEGIGPVLNNVALAYERIGDRERARTLYERAEKASGDLLPTLNLARIDVEEGRGDEARRRLFRVIREDARLRYAALLEYGAMDLRGGGAGEAFEHFQQASLERPWEAGPFVGMGEARAAAGDAEEARRFFRMADERRPGMARLGELRIAERMLEEGNAEAAEEVYGALLDQDPGDGEVANRYAWLLAEGGRDLDRALALARSARRKEPSNASYADTEGWTLVRLGRPAEGAASLEEAIRLGLAGAGVRYRLGLALMRSDREDEGRKELEEALARDPGSPYADEARGTLGGAGSTGERARSRR